ncbi:hypothetical protein E4U42_007588 [Claviceps africana]|uniref:Uncharacterized protein n=1 Tax=Claviceps africana TaxID=83212 RepID=A0A8K0JDF2_9HYPO|nr:hypothetical protein E4U42_007588 [Claviceps africana]
MDQEDNPILSIQLSDPEDQDLDPVKKKADRTAQTEDEFQSVKAVYRARVENGHIYEHVQLPLRPGATKMHTQEVIHAVEELYFHRKFQLAIDLVDRAFGHNGEASVDSDSRQLLTAYRKKCQHKLRATTHQA